MIDSAAGETSAPPRPWSAAGDDQHRRPRSASAVEQRGARRRSPMPTMKSRLRPSRSASASAEQQEAAEHQRVGVDDPLQAAREKSRSVWIDGSATLTIVASSTTMNCAKQTTTRATQRARAERASGMSGEGLLENQIGESVSTYQSGLADPLRVTGITDGAAARVVVRSALAALRSAHCISEGKRPPRRRAGPAGARGRSRRPAGPAGAVAVNRSYHALTGEDRRRRAPPALTGPPPSTGRTSVLPCPDGGRPTFGATAAAARPRAVAPPRGCLPSVML